MKKINVKKPSKQTFTTIALALMIVGATVVGTGAAFAQSQNVDLSNKGRWHKFEYRTHMHNALEAGDYERWKEMTEGTPIQEKITNEAEFGQLVLANEYMEDGEFEEAEAILQELGIEKPFHGGHKSHHGLGLRVYLELTDEEAMKLEEARDLFQAGNERAAREIIDSVRESFKARKHS